MVPGAWVAFLPDKDDEDPPHTSGAMAGCGAGGGPRPSRGLRGGGGTLRRGRWGRAGS